MGLEQYEGSTGWLEPLKWASVDLVSQLKKLAEEVREKADVFVLVGVGGSNQAARAVIEALETKGGPQILYAGNSLSARAMERVLRELEGKSVYINVVAKNFETLEPGVAFRILRVWMKETYGAGYEKRIICTGTKGSAFEKLCEEQGYEFLLFPDDIGGRYSAISSVGLFPMAVAGIPIEELVQGAVDMAKLISKNTEEGKQVYQYAQKRLEMYKAGCCMEMLVFFEPDLQWFSRWWIQLFAESEGKQEKGLYPVAFQCSEDLHSTGQFVQEGSKILFETFLEVEDAEKTVWIKEDTEWDGFSYLDGKTLAEVNKKALEAVWGAHKARNYCYRITIPKLDAYWFGRMFYFFEFACYLSAKMLGVNPFDQPGVEAYKCLLFEKLGKGGK